MRLKALEDNDLKREADKFDRSVGELEAAGKDGKLRLPPTSAWRRISVGQPATLMIVAQTMAVRNGRRIQNADTINTTRNSTESVVCVTSTCLSASRRIRPSIPRSGQPRLTLFHRRVRRFNAPADS